MKTSFFLTLSIGLFFSIPPLLALVTVPGALTHEQKIQKKDSIQGTIPIHNEGDEEAIVKITLTDYLFTAEGQSSFPPAGTSSRSNASWISFGASEVKIAPHSIYNFTYSLKVPDKEELTGTYWSIFLIEPIQEKFSSSDKKQSLGVQTIIRYGIQVISHAGETGSYNLKILDKKLLKEQESKTFLLDVENSGTKMQSPNLTLEVIDSQGVKTGRFTAEKQRIFPTCSVNYQIDLSSIAPGKYKAMAILDHAETALFGAQYDLDID